ncbi:hypothetical protein LMG28727_01358 [Paraburkholderia kirstenboschensis]|nr:hypothetical protein LMG28727_01358 [Paraburkholderia kirstenboschensis]
MPTADIQPSELSLPLPLPLRFDLVLRERPAAWLITDSQANRARKSVSTRLSAVAPSSAAIGVLSQASAGSRASKTSAARATRRASRSSLADSSRLKTPSRLRRAKVRLGISSACANSACVKPIDLSMASSARDEIPWRTTSTHSRPDRGARGKTVRPSSSESADTLPIRFTSLPSAIWH